MPLTHVCAWDPKIGYRRISIEEACILHSSGATARSGSFVCELCAQNVLLTAPGANVQHFRHDPNSPNKECDERQASFDSTYGRAIRSLNSHAMPLRLDIKASTFSLQLGFFRPPDQTARCNKIVIGGDRGQVLYEYSFERIENRGTTYLSIGTIPNTKYKIKYENATAALSRYWSNSIPGVSVDGSFFESRTGQILQAGGKAYYGDEYYLLQRSPLYSGTTDIDVHEVSKIQDSSFSTWYIYRIHAKKFSEQAAKFFLKRAIFLTDRPTLFYPIWPPYVKKPYFIYHNSKKLYFYLCGDDAELKSYPAIAIPQETHEGRLYKLFTRDREQLVSFGKAGALGFSYLIREQQNQQADLPTVKILDADGNQLLDSEYTKLPKSKFITISCKYDGKAIVRKKGTVVRIYRLSAEQNTVIEGLTFGTEILFYQGLDTAGRLSFVHSKGNESIQALDADLLNKLKACKGEAIPVSHAMCASFIKYFRHYPQTMLWLYKVNRTGRMPRLAYLLLKNQLKNNNSIT